MGSPKGNPSTTTAQSQSGVSSGSSAGSVSPNADTLALYNALLGSAFGTASTPYNPATAQQVAPWTDSQSAAINNLYTTGMNGFDPRILASGLNAANAGMAPTAGNIGALANSLAAGNPYAGAAVNYGLDRGNAIGSYATNAGNAISNYGINLAARGPQLEQFSQGAIDKYMSPYINDVVNATQNQFTNANAQQGNALIGQAIRSGNAFGGDRAGVAQGVLAGQQQLTQAPVIAGLYNTGYNTALGEFNTNNALAAQLGQMAIGAQTAGGQLGTQGLTSGAQVGLAGYGLGLQNYTNAQNVAAGALSNDANRDLSAGALFGNLGSTSLTGNLAAGNTAFGAAGAYPAYIQNLLNANSSNAAAASAYPFQTTGWLSQLLGGLGPLTGTNTSGTTNATTSSSGTGLSTPPQPSSIIQGLGLGIAGTNALANILPFLAAKDGGAVPHMADGGSPFAGMPYSMARSYIPNLTLPHGSLATPSINAAAAQLAPLNLLPASTAATPAASNPMGDLAKLFGNKDTMKDFGKSLGALSNSFGGNSSEAGAAPTVGEFSARGGPVRGGYYDFGGAVDDDNEGLINKYIGGRPEVDGGIINVRSDAQHFDDGGDTDDDQTPFQVAEMRPTKGTWFYTEPGGFKGDNGVWNDVQGAREGKPASGLSSDIPGIAVPNRNTLGHYYRVQAPNGEEQIVQQTDYGPGRGPVANGIGIDINAPLADRFGYTPKNFPSGGQFKYEYLGKENPEGDLPQSASLVQHEPAGGPPTQANALADYTGDGAVHGPNSLGAPGPAGQRVPFPGGPPPKPTGLAGALQAWATSPITAIGLSMAASRNPNMLGAVGEGLQGGQRVAAAQAQQAKLDAKPELTSMGGEMVWKMANGDIIKTGAPSPAGMTDARQRESTAESRATREAIATDNREARKQTASEASKDRRDRAAATAYPGEGQDAEGNTVKGLYQFNPDTREYDFKPGKTLQKGAGAGAGKEGAVQSLAKWLMEADPNLTREQAVTKAQRADQSGQDAVRRLRLAIDGMKNDPEGRPLEYWEKHYGVTPGAKTAPAAPATPPSGIPQAPQAPKSPTAPEVKKQLKDGTLTEDKIRADVLQSLAENRPWSKIEAMLKSWDLDPSKFRPAQVPMSP